MNILQLLASSSFITLNKNVIKAVGLEEALLLGELCSEYDYWLKRGGCEDGYFFSTVENIEENTTLNDYKQRKAFKNLQNLKILEIKVMGLPAKRYFKINEEQLFKLLNINNSNYLSSSIENFKELGLKKFECNKNKDNKNIFNDNIEDKKEKPIRHKHGEYGHVLLTDDQLNKLKEKFVDYQEKIQNLDDYIEMKGAKYKNHYLTIIKWSKKDEPKQVDFQQPVKTVQKKPLPKPKVISKQEMNSFNETMEKLLRGE